MNLPRSAGAPVLVVRDDRPRTAPSQVRAAGTVVPAEVAAHISQQHGVEADAGSRGKRLQFRVLRGMGGRGCCDHPVERGPAAGARDVAPQRGTLGHAFQHVTDLVAGGVAERAERVQAGAGDHHPAQPAHGVLTDRCTHCGF